MTWFKKSWYRWQAESIARSVETRTRPLFELAAAVSRAAFGCAESLKAEIKPEQHPEAWVYVCFEFVYFFMHLVNRSAFSILGGAGESELQNELRPVVAKGVIAGLFDHWPEDLKSRIGREFFEKLNDSEVEYGKCPGVYDENEPYTGNSLVSALARNVAELMGSPSDPVVMLQVIRVVTTELKALNFDALVRAAGEQPVSPKGILGVRTQPSAASQIARSLFECWVEKDDFPPLPENALSASFWPKYQRKWHLYREATVLMVLLGKEQKDSRYAELVKEYERLIYPSDKPTPEGLAKQEALRTTMQDIARLVGGDLRSRSKAPELTWAREWFEELGELPKNPVDCMMFAYTYMELWIAVAKTVEDAAKERLVP